MRTIKLTNHILTREGTLLLRRGQEIELTDERESKLKQLGLWDEVMRNSKDADNSDVMEGIKKKEQIVSMYNSEMKSSQILKETAIEKHQAVLQESFDTLQKKMNGAKLQELDKASDILGDILNTSKDTSWFNHLNVLMNYVNWLYGHSINVALISCMIGDKIGYGDARLRELTLAALLHDIGMVLLPRNILNNDNVLNEMEMELVRSHSDLGAAMLLETEVSERCRRIVLEHHEKSDGSGYPNRLTSIDLLEESAIVMAAEYFDTATTHRPYKNARKVDDVVAEIEEQENQFDHVVVKQLRACFIH